MRRKELDGCRKGVARSLYPAIKRGFKPSPCSASQLGEWVILEIGNSTFTYYTNAFYIDYMLIQLLLPNMGGPFRFGRTFGRAWRTSVLLKQ